MTSFPVIEEADRIAFWLKRFNQCMKSKNDGACLAELRRIMGFFEGLVERMKAHVEQNPDDKVASDKLLAPMEEYLVQLRELAAEAEKRYSHLLEDDSDGDE